MILTIFSACSTGGQKVMSPEDRKTEIYYTHGTQALIDKDYTSALLHLRQAAELDPKDSKVQNNLGMAYFFKEQTEKAIEHLKRAIELDNKNSDARVNLAGIYYSQKRYQLALQEYFEVSKDLVYQNQFRTYYNMALIFEKLNKTAEAREYLAKSIKENENYCPAYFFEGKMNEKIKQYKDALRSFEKATIGQCFEEPAPHFAQAKMLEKLNRIVEAKDKYRMIMEKFSRTPYFALAVNELKILDRTKTLNSEEEMLRQVRSEMDQLRERQNSEQPKTYQGTSF